MWITFYHQSRRYRKSLGLEDNRTNRKKAKNKIIPEIQYKLSTGEFFTKQKLTIDDVAQLSFEIHEHERRAITHKDYMQRYELHIKPYFKNFPIEDIKVSDLAKWQSSLLKNMSGASFNNIRKIFNTFFEDAMRDELIIKNPMKLLKPPSNDSRYLKRPLSIEEVYNIIDNVPEHIRAFFAVGFFTGMRTGEIIGLKWEDLDFKEKLIYVRRSRRRCRDMLPKTKHSIRDIDMIDVLIPYLLHHKQHYCLSEYVFTSQFKQAFSSCDKISHSYWRPALEKLEMPYRNLYQMRHTFASIMIANGEDILWVSNMLGHKNSSMTLEKYARYIRDKKKKRAIFLSR